MAQVGDTNILYRHNEETLEYVQLTAQHILQRGGAFSEEGLSLIADFDKTCTEKRISAGGCADLLGVTILLHDLNLLDAYGFDRSCLVRFSQALANNKEYPASKQKVVSFEPWENNQSIQAVAK
jgi:hypothetical protein